MQNPFPCRPLLIFLLLAFYSCVRACGYEPPPFQGYSLLHPELIAAEERRYLLFNQAAFHAYFQSRDPWWTEPDTITVDENIREWAHYFRQAATPADIAILIYRTPVDFFTRALSADQVDTPLAADFGLADNSLVALLRRAPRPAFLRYLHFAKQCEMLTAPPADPWAPALPPTPADTRALMRAGEARYRQETDAYLRLRYAFQLVRLAHYTGGNPAEAYDRLVVPLTDVQSVIRYWALGHKAGYLSQRPSQRQRDLGHFLLAQVVAHTQDRQLPNLRSFRISNPAAWKRLQALASTAEASAAIHFTRALKTSSLALEDLRAIYHLQPRFDRLDLLLYRELQKVEAQQLQTPFMAAGQADTPPAATAYLKALRLFIEQVAAEGRTARPALWTLAAAYAQLLDRDLSAARITLTAAARAAAGDSLLADQVEVLRLVLELNTFDRIDPSLERQLGELALHNRAFNRLLLPRWQSRYDEASDSWIDERQVGYYYDEHEYIADRLADIYQRQGDMAKAYLIRYSAYGLKFMPRADLARQVLALWDKPDKNYWEHYLLEKETHLDRPMLLDVYGTALLAEDRLPEAVAALEPLANDTLLLPWPFATPLHLERRAPAGTTMINRYQVAREALSLQAYLAQHDGDAAAWLRLGNYYYNTSYWGYAWRVRDYFISILSAYQYEPLTALPPPGPAALYGNDYYRAEGVATNLEWLDLRPARSAYERALQAEDPEIRAAARFALGIITYQTHSRTEEAFYEGRLDTVALRTLFREMERRYGQTAFTADTRQQCKLYQRFAAD